MCCVLTTGAVLSIEAGASAVTFVVVQSEPHTHSGVLTRVVATRIHCKDEDKIMLKSKTHLQNIHLTCVPPGEDN